MLNAIRIHFARKAYNRAAKERAAYDLCAIGAPWNVTVSCALIVREERAARRLADLIAR